MRVLLTNDDGYGADGLTALITEIETLEDWHVTVVAPDGERSASSMSLTIFRDLVLKRQAHQDHYTLDGFPADCVNAAINIDLFADFDLIISGINQGPNLGDDVHYSGTVAGARQAALKGIPAVAVSAPVQSQQIQSGMPDVAHWAVRWIQTNLRELGSGIVYNINFPADFASQATPKPVFCYTRQGRRTYHDDYDVHQLDTHSYHLRSLETRMGYEPASGTDFEAIAAGQISVTPLDTYTTHLDELKRWQSKPK